MRYFLTVISFLKRKVFNRLPAPLLTVIKKFYYSRDLRSFSMEQEPDLKVLKYLVHNGDHAIDIGANYGIYTKALSQLVGSSGRVHSIEPVPETFEILCSNIKKLGLENVEPIHCAISDVNATVTLEIPSYAEGGENYYQAHIIKNNAAKTNLRCVHVPSFTIDSKFESIANRISFIKCDVEGYELECLRGAMIFLDKFKPAWLIEISEDPNNAQSAAYQLFILLRDKGYGAWWFDGNLLRQWHVGDKSINFFFLHDDHISSIKKQNSDLFQ